MDDRMFYGTVFALFALFAGHPVLAFIVILLALA